MIISPLVLAEVDHLAKARFGTQARTTIVDFVMDLDLADAVNVGLAAHYRTDAILTLDRRDFRAMRPLTTHEWFRLLPDDL